MESAWTYHGWDMDALPKQMGSAWTLSCLGHLCSAETDGVWVDVRIMTGTRMLCVMVVCGRGGWTASAKQRHKDTR